MRKRHYHKKLNISSNIIELFPEDRKFLLNYLFDFVINSLNILPKYSSQEIFETDDFLNYLNIVLPMFIKNNKNILKSLHEQIKIMNDEEKNNYKNDNRYINKEITSLLINIIPTLKKEFKYYSYNSILKDKIDYLIKHLNLSKKTKNIFIYALLNFYFDFDDLLGISRLTKTRVKKLYYQLLNLKSFPKDINILFEIDLLRLENGSYSPFDIITINENFIGILDNPKISNKNVFDDFYYFNKQKAISLSNFSYLNDDTYFLQNLLKSTLKKNIKGVNILLYGKPGTGKTAYTHSIINSIKYSSINIKANSKNKSNNRFISYKLAQLINKKSKNSVIVFDEADDILNIKQKFLFFNSSYSEYKDKSELIEALEENIIPVIWIVNDISSIPKEIKRRFSYSIDFSITPEDIKTNIIKKKLNKYPFKNQNDKLKIINFIKSNDFSLGEITLAISKSKQLDKSKSNNYDNKYFIEKTLTRMLDLDNKQNKDIKNMSHYNIDLINIKSNPKEIINSIKQYYTLRDKKDLYLPIKNLNILFYGKPGTGKTEFAKYIAHSLDKNVIIKNASNLLGMFVGQTEQQIRQAFNKAEKTDSILFLDEADSFFNKRESAIRSWEKTQVNEILNAMENFKGILIATTNFLDNFDKASLRRFSHKIKFNTLTNKQKLEAFKIVFKNIILEDDNVIYEKLKKINELTMGDFKNAYQQVVFTKNINIDKVINILSNEEKLKTQNKNKVGF